MNIAKFSIKRPIFISCIVFTILLAGAVSFKNIGLDLMPSVDFPTVRVQTTYEGAAPQEIADNVSRPIEDKLSAVANVKHITSENREGQSVLSVEFETGTNMDEAVQNVRDKVGLAVANLPDDAETPIVQKIDPDDRPVMKLLLSGDLTPAEMYDLANETIAPQLARVDGVGSVSIIGATRREIHVELDKKKLDAYRLSISQVVNRISGAGSNISVGDKEEGKKRTVFRSVGEFNNYDQILNTAVDFSGDLGRSTSVKELGVVKNGVVDETSRGFVYYPSTSVMGKGEQAVSAVKDKPLQCLYLTITKQSGSNSVKVSDGVQKKIKELEKTLKGSRGNPQLVLALDTTTWIHTNVQEALVSILLGIFMAIFVVYLFLGNVRSTIITAIAIPNSLLGAFIIINLMGYTLNLMTLMALSLTVGLLVDDAIVVRENIFRKLEQGMSAPRAAIFGTKEVMLAVIATTMSILAVYLPMGTLSGVMGDFLKQFGFTVVFAMIVSLFDALTVAPFLSAYFAGDGSKSNNRVVRAFERFQTWLDTFYGKVVNFALYRPMVVISCTVAVFIVSLWLVGFVKKSFTPQGGDEGQFAVTVDMPSGTSLDGTQDTLRKIEARLRDKIPDIKYYLETSGSSSSDPTQGEIDIFLNKKRQHDTDYYKFIVRKMMKEFKYANPAVTSLTSTSAGQMKPFTMVVYGKDLASVEKAADDVQAQLEKVSDITEISSSAKKGNPEFQVFLDPDKMKQYGVAPNSAGNELRYSVEGKVPSQFHANGLEYDIRVRLEPEQRNLEYTYANTKIPNVSNFMIPLKQISTGKLGTGSSILYRQDKLWIVRLRANLTPNGAMADGMKKADNLIKKNVVFADGVGYTYTGQSEEMGKTLSQIVFVLLLAVVFIYFVLSSLYESFITPVIILLAIPPAMTGALLALFITNEQLNMFSMIGVLFLMGIVTKNSILLVDFALAGVRAGMSRKDAIIAAGRKRLRPILMTTIAMLAGTLPLALGIGSAAKMRQAMGIAIIGGLIVSTLITLLVVPAIFEYIDKFREFVESRFRLKDPKAVDESDADMDREIARLRKKK